MDSGCAYEAAIDFDVFTAFFDQDLTAPPGQSVSLAANDPQDGDRYIEPDGTEMQVFMKFELSAHDMASGSYEFDIVPEPSSWRLWLLLAAVRARRLR